MLSEHPNVSPEAKGARLKRLRNLANLSRKELCAKFGIKIDTLIGWELARHGGLTENGASKMIDIFYRCGVQCSIEWLLTGAGNGPSLFSDNTATDLQAIMGNDPIAHEDKRILQEYLYFKRMNPAAVYYVINDDSMAPHYEKGDYVAGTQLNKDKFPQVSGHDCIIQIKNGDLLLRKIYINSANNSIDLLATNFYSGATNLVIHNPEISFIAPVIWHRRKNRF